MRLSERVRKIREAHQLTQADVADKMNIATSSYGQIERNASKATLETLQKVADAIGVTLVFLVDLHSERYHP